MTMYCMNLACRVIKYAVRLDTYTTSRSRLQSLLCPACDQQGEEADI